MLQFGASLTYDTSSDNYNCNMFIIQATGLIVGSKARIVRRLKQIQLTNALAYFSPLTVTKKKVLWYATKWDVGVERVVSSGLLISKL